MKKLKINTFLFYWLPPVLWAGIIFSFSSHPTTPVAEIHWQDFIFKKTVHVIEYFLLGILLFRALKGNGIKFKESLIYTFLFVVFYGFTDEFHQSFTPGREPNIRDVFFDGIGGFLSILFITVGLDNSPSFLVRLAKRLEIYKNKK